MWTSVFKAPIIAMPMPRAKTTLVALLARAILGTAATESSALTSTSAQDPTTAMPMPFA